MSSPSQVRRTVRRTLMLSAVATAASLSAVAQEQRADKAAVDQPAASPEAQEVVVTGTRLTNPNLTSISPVTSVTAAEVQQTGLVRVEDILNQLPQVFVGQNATVVNGASGEADLDLRGLGSQRTLVLLNGRRLGPGGAGTNVSDISTIPTQLIDHIDVETGGASSVYGADAVAGAVNFVLNTHFEGLKIDANYGFNQHNNGNPIASAVTAAGDQLPGSEVNTGFTKNLSVIFGSNFADGKGNATFFGTFDETNAVLAGSYDYGACSLNGSFGCGGSPTGAKNGAGGWFRAYDSQFTKQLLPNNPKDMYGGATVAPGPGGKTGVLQPFNSNPGGDLYNFGPINYFQRPNQRFTGGAFVNYQVNDKVTVYGEAMFVRNTSSAQIAASGDFETGTFIPCTNPQLSQQEQSTLCAPSILAAQGNMSESVIDPVTHQPVNVPGVLTYIGRRSVEGMGRIASFTNDTMRLVIGTKGEIIDGITFDVSGSWDNVDSQTPNEGYFGANQVVNALNTIGLTPSGSVATTYSPTNTANCAVPSGDAKCVPYNVWAPNGVTGAAGAAQLAYLTIPLLTDSTTTEYVVSGSVSADLTKYGVKLPMAQDGLDVVLGAEYRNDSAASQPDEESIEGNAEGAGGAATPVSGSIHVAELFTELGVPLVQHKAFAEDLSLKAGYRYSSYSLGFDTNTYNVGLDWAPTKDVKVRASYNHAVRAPNIGELFSPQSVVLDGTFDPCAGPVTNGVTSHGATQAQCLLTGVPAASFGHIVPCPSNQCNGLEGGNPTLKPEEADTYSGGVVFTPTFVPGLQFSADYFNIKITDAIQPIGSNEIADLCIETSSPTYCGLFHREAPYSLGPSQFSYVEDLSFNQGSYATRGIDFAANYKEHLGGFGTLNYSFQGTKVINLTSVAFEGGPPLQCIGFYAGACGSPNPAWRHNFSVSWQTPWDGLDITAIWRYYGEVTSQLDAYNIPGYSHFDLNTSFDIYKGIRAQVGVNNVFDKDPPIVNSADCPVGPCNNNTFPGSYDALGRFLYVHVTAQF